MKIKTLQNTWRHVFALFILPLFAFLAYRSVLHFPFTDVDTWPLLLTSQFDSLQGFFSLFQKELLDGRMINARYYRPLLTISYGIDEHLWGFNPFGFHLTDLTLHAANACGVYLLTFMLMGKSKSTLALLAGLIFLLHPIQVENVPAIARRAELLAGFFFWISLATFLLSWKKPLFSWLAGLGLFCGLLCKENIIIMPCIFMAAIYFLHPSQTTLDKASWKKRLRVFLPVSLKLLPPTLLSLMLYLLLRFAALDGMGGYVQGERFMPRLLTNLFGQPLGLLFAGFSPLWTKMIDHALHFNITRDSLILLSFALALVVSLYGFVKFLPKAKNRPSFTPGTLPFLFFCFAIHALLLALFGFNFRYLYLETIPISILLAIGLNWLPLWREKIIRGKGGKRIGYASISLLLILVWGNLLLGSVLFVRSPLKHWNHDALLSDRLFQDVDRLVGSKEVGSYFFLINFPYQRIAHPWVKFLTVPLSIITLEHSVQAYVDLHHPEKKSRVIGLSYLYLDGQTQDPSPLVVDTSFEQPDLINIRVLQGGYPTALPWNENFGPRYKGSMYETTRPSAEEKEFLTIHLSPEAMLLPNKYFAVFDGGDNLEVLENPFQSKPLTQKIK